MAKNRKKVSRGVRLAVYRRDNWTCQHCGRKFAYTLDGSAPLELDWNPEKNEHDYVWLEIDHIHPVSRRDIAHQVGINDIANLQSACTPCNRRKSAFLPEDRWDSKFAIAIQLLRDLPPSAQSAERIISELLGRPFRIRTAAIDDSQEVSA